MKVFKRPRKPTAENLQVKTRVENVRFLSWRIFFVGKYGIQSTNEMAFKRTLTLRASFRFPAIRFDAPTLLSFSGFTHAHAKCPPVSGTLISDTSDHFSQFCIVKSAGEKPKGIYKTKVSDYSRFSADSFDDELSQTEWGNILFNATGDIDKTFSMKTLLHHKGKQFSNPNSKLLEKQPPLFFREIYGTVYGSP